MIAAPAIQTAVARICATLIVAIAFSMSGAIPAHALKIQEVHSPGGITAWLVEDYTVPIISMQFSFEGGTTQDPKGKEGLANLMTGLFDEGAGKLDSETFQNELDVAAADMGFSADRDRITGSIRMLTDHQDDAFKLLALAVNDPRFDKGPVDRIREQIVAGIKSSEKRPRKIAGRKWREALYGSHPYSRPEEGTEESLASITPDDLRNLHKDIFARSNLKIAVVGAINAGKLAGVLDEVFGALPEKADLLPVTKADVKLGQIIDVKADQPQTSIQLAYPGVYRSDPRFFAAYLMNNILGGGDLGSQLSNELRNKRGLVYGVNSYLATNEYSSALGISTSTRSDRAAETLSVIRDVVAKMASEGPSEGALKSEKQYVLGSYAINNLGSSSDIASALLGMQQEHLGIDYIDRRQELIDGVTLDDVREIAKTLLSAIPAVMVVGPDPAKVTAAIQ
jgi:zinc protease